MPRVGVVILAAGRGSRLGGVAKALIERGGQTFLERIAGTCDRAMVAPAVVVVGEPFAGQVAEHAAELGLEVAVNPDPDRGMGSSVEVGFAHAAQRWGDLDAALLWPVDHPWVELETVAAIAGRAATGAVVIPVVGRADGDRGGHPTAVGRDLWAALAACADVEGGARGVFRHNRDRVVRLAVADIGVARDVDRPEDLA
jgi:nicotine blue oxidoreductase